MPRTFTSAVFADYKKSAVGDNLLRAQVVAHRDDGEVFMFTTFLYYDGDVDVLNKQLQEILKTYKVPFLSAADRRGEAIDKLPDSPLYNPVQFALDVLETCLDDKCTCAALNEHPIPDKLDLSGFPDYFTERWPCDLHPFDLHGGALSMLMPAKTSSLAAARTLNKETGVFDTIEGNLKR